MLRRLLKDIRPFTREVTEARFTTTAGVTLRLCVLDFEPAPQVGMALAFRFSCRNEGMLPAPPVRLVLSWNLAEGAGSAPLARQPAAWVEALAPGAEALHSTTVAVPINSAVKVAVSLSLETADGMALQEQGAPVRLRRRLIGAGAGADFDYRDAYAKADLEQDWWSIVGPATLDEYITQGQRKLAQLRRLGLKPETRFLDIGCGTGQVSEQLVGFLSPSGVYVGTDVAEEAVAFCRRRFPQANFRFLRNEGVTLPIQAQEFDTVYLASVFTHLDLAEIRGLLAEIRRLLASGGWVLADAFVSPAVPDQAGNRSMMTINETALQRAFGEHGFTWQEVGAAPWNADCRRVVYRLAAQPQRDPSCQAGYGANG